MNTKTSPSFDLAQNKNIKSTSNRKIYKRDDFFRFYNCSAEIPDYLKDFEFQYNNFTQENWCKKPLLKFVPENKGKSIYPNNKLKGRQRTLSNQSGEYFGEYHDYNKQSYTSNGKFNRYGNSPNEMNSNEDIKTDLINSNNFQHNPESQRQKVELKSNRLFNASKPYSLNIQLAENHWKKWTKDTTPATDKIHRSQNVPFNKSEKSNNIWLRKSESGNRQRNPKFYGRHSVSKSGDQTEDIWQDDWDTEMKSEIAKDDIILDSFPKLSITPPPIEPKSKLINLIFDAPTDSVIPKFDMWFYQDLSSIERGPFTSDNMANWFATGCLNSATFVRRMCDERFLLLAEYRALYGRIPFTAGSTIPPILLNTPIEIEINQLLIGVEGKLIQKVINCAACLSHIPQNNVRVEENLNISPNSAILMEKRLLDESRAELERERERMIQEQIQWRARVEAELHAKMQAELNAKMEEIKLQQSIAVINAGKSMASIDQNISQPLIIESDKPISNIVSDIVENVPQSKEKSIPSVEHKSAPVNDRWEIDEANIQQALSNTDNNNHWFSTKDNKIQKKNKKLKAREKKNVREEKETIVPIPEAKHPDQPTDTRLSIVTRESLEKTASKENVSTSKVRPIKFEMEHRKNEPLVSWTSANVVPANVKSLIEIQAEESKKIQTKIEFQKAVLSSEIETSKITEVPYKLPAESRKSENAKLIWGTMSKSPKVYIQAGKSFVDIQVEEMQNELIENKLAKNAILIQKKESERIMEELRLKEIESRKEAQARMIELEKAVKLKDIEAENLKNKKKSAILIETNKIIGKPVKIELPVSTKPSLISMKTTVPIVTKSLIEIQAETAKENQTKDPKITEIKATGNPMKTETSVSWKSSPALPSTVPPITKSLLEIQAEEAVEEKRNKEIQDIAKTNEIEANKITSFKESLLKSTKQVKIPIGQSIWDVLPAETPVNKMPVQTSEMPVKKDVVNKIQKNSSNESNVIKKEVLQDHLTLWCQKKLAKFSEKFELNTVIELLKEVPNEEVMELALQLLDDSKFTSTFVVDFINKRQELFNNQAGDTWQTVKKSFPTPPHVSSTKNKSAKSKSKKKMVLIDTKFR